MTDTDDNRPSWTYSTAINVFRTISRNCIMSIRYETRIGADWQTEDVLILGYGKDKTIEVDHRFLNETGERLFKFHRYPAGHQGLLELTYEGEKARTRLNEIEKWDAKHERDRREYERLRRKFGDITP